VYVEKPDGPEEALYYSIKGHFWNWDGLELKHLRKWRRIRDKETQLSEGRISGKKKGKRTTSSALS
jgi:hypothetical protein